MASLQRTTSDGIGRVREERMDGWMDGWMEGWRDGGREVAMEVLHKLAQNGYYRIRDNNKKVDHTEHN